MAQTGFTPISLYFSTTPSAVPLGTDLVAGELALNTIDEKLYFKNSSGTVKLLASTASTTNVASISFGSTGLTPSTATTGAVTVGGTLAIANGGTGSTSTTYCSLTANVTGTLPIGNGGTNITTYTTGDILYASATNTLSKLPIGTSGQLLSVSGGGIPAWSAAPSTGLTVGTTSITSGSNGFILYNNAGVLGNLATTGSGSVVLATSPTLVTPILGTPTSGTLTNCTGYTTANLSGSISLTTQVTGTLPVANGGTGATTITANSVILGNGTSALNANLVAPGSSGNVLTSNGTTWTSAAAAAGGFTNATAYVSPGTFTTPSTTTRIKVTLVSGGGSGGVAGNPAPTSRGTGGGGGGYAQGIFTVTASTAYPVTVGAGGSPVTTFVGPGGTTPGNSGGSSSFGALISATGGAGGPSGTGTPGPAAGGTGSGGFISIQGQSSASGGQGTAGGNSILGFNNLSTAPTGSGQNYGAAGSGLGPNGGTGGAGAGGIVIVEF